MDSISPTTIQRHKTTIRRSSFSAPVNCLLRDALLTPDRELFDYGCGYGQDIELLRSHGFSCDGWDPYHRPLSQKREADVINLGYVLNVIENPTERDETLRTAWQLSKQVLVIAAQVYGGDNERATPYSDGIVTSRGTFQKFYTQKELRLYLEGILDTFAIPAGPGIFYVFRDEGVGQEFLARRCRRVTAIPRKRVSEVLFDQNQDILNPFVEVISRLGRLPTSEEYPEYAALVDRFGSLKRAFAIVRRVTGNEAWKAIAQQRREDLCVYLALSRFHRRPPLSKLSSTMQQDVKAFCGTYERACRDADALLFQTGQADVIETACRESLVGQLTENGLLIHRTALHRLDPVLRTYEGCARALLGDFEEANIIKLHRFSGKVSYLAYRDYDEHPNPQLKMRVKVALRSLDIDFYNYEKWATPPILEDKTGLLSTE